MTNTSKSGNSQTPQDLPDTDGDLRGQTESVSVRQILSLALPALGVLAAMPLYMLWDTAVVGRLGATELAALGGAVAIQSVVTTQLTFLSFGTTARAARLFGAGRRQAAVEEGMQATWVALAVGAVLGLGMIIGAPQLCRWLLGVGQPAELAAQWLRACAPIIPAALVVMAGNGWLRGVQNTRLPLYFTLAGVVPATVLVPVFVDRFSLVGSAYANVVGESITATLFLVCLFRQPGRRSLTPDFGVISSQLVLGRDLILRSLAFQVAFLSAAGVASRMGEATLAGHQILLQLWNFLSLVLDSLAIAAQALVGAALGAGSAVRARGVGMKVIGFSLAAAAMMSAVLVAGSRWIPGLFTRDAAVLSGLGTPWWILSGMVILGGCAYALDGVLLGAGDATYLRNATLASVACGFIPGVWIAWAVGVGLTGIWFGIAAFMLLRCVFIGARFISMKWAKVS